MEDLWDALQPAEEEEDTGEVVADPGAPASPGARDIEVPQVDGTLLQEIDLAGGTWRGISFGKGATGWARLTRLERSQVPSYSVRCIWHRKGAKTDCKKQFKVLGDTPHDHEVCCRRLLFWCLQGRDFACQREHLAWELAADDVPGLMILRSLIPAHIATRAEIVHDVDLDGRGVPLDIMPPQSWTWELGSASSSAAIVPVATVVVVGAGFSSSSATASGAVIPLPKRGQRQLAPIPGRKASVAKRSKSVFLTPADSDWESSGSD